MSDIISQAFKEGAAEINRLRTHIAELEAENKRLRSTLAQVREWRDKWEHDLYAIGGKYDLDSILSTDNEVLAVVDGWWDDCFQAPFHIGKGPNKEIPHTEEMWQPVTVTVTRRKEVGDESGT